MRQRIVTAVCRPEFWLVCLLCWVLASANRSLGTPWAHAAVTEALRWSAGLLLVLALGAWRRGAGQMARFFVLLVGALAAFGTLDGLHPNHGGLVGPFQDHQLYGSVLLVLLPFAAALALTARESVWRWGALAAGTAGVMCLFLSQTRSAWAGLLAGVVVFGWLWAGRTRQRPQQGRRAALTIAVLLAGVCAAWMLLGSAELRVPIAARAATLTNLGGDGSWQGRLIAWRGAARLIETYPAAGIGLGRYPGTQSAWTHVGRLLGAETRPSLSEEAHSFYLQTAAETGLIGLGLYLAVAVSFAVQGLRRLRSARRHHPVAGDAVVIAALSALAGQMLDAFASPSWQFPEASLLFWAVLGLGLAAMGQEVSQERQDAKIQSAALLLFLRRPLQLAFTGLAFVAFTAQVLPIGLLTPVEAYTTAADWTYVSVSLTPSAATASVGSTVTFQLIATYTSTNTDGSTASHLVNVSTDKPGANSWYAYIDPHITPTYGTFVPIGTPGSVSSYMSYTVPAGTSKKTLNIHSAFNNNGTTTNKETTLKIS